MAPPAGTLRVGRYFTALLLLLAVLYSIVALGSRHNPKLGIDLVGGKRVIFTALSPKGAPPPTGSQMTQARQIIEDRINGTGVTGATVQVQGGNQLVVLIPGGTNTDVAKLGKAAVLNFRGVIAPAQPVTCTTGRAGAAGASASPSTATSGATTPSTTPSSTPTSPAPRTRSSQAAANDASHRQLAAAPSRAKSPAATKSPGKSPAKSGATSAVPASGAASSAAGSAAPTTGASSAAAAPRCLADPIAAVVKADPTLKNKIPNAETCPTPALASGATCLAYSTLTTTQQQELAAAQQRFDCAAAQTELDDPTRYYLACDNSQGFPVAYLLGHVIVPGRGISSAAAQAPNVSGTGGNAEWTVSLNLNGSGADNWNSWTSKYHTTGNVTAIQTSATAPCGTSVGSPCSYLVAFTLDGEVLSVPVTQAVLDRQTSVSGNFTQTTASDLARELNYGKLPLSFRTDANQSVSATLGSQQLNAAFIAGGIGLALVVIYSLLYYRGLGLVTIASLLVSAGLTYAMLVLLGTQIGFTLDLAGIAGFIVALGITADSFVVFFERIKDEVHEGRSMRVAVPRAWVRARRTILSADTVSFLAAAILYYFASADVKGFAFTLGMSTILDLVVVFLFTHPIVSLLSRSRTFGSPRFTGLNSVRIGGIVDDELPERSARRSRPARGRTVSTVEESRPARSRSSTAVLDEDEDLEPAEVDATEAVDTDAARVDVPEEPQRRTTGEATGETAAERAAARRARMRAERDEEGTS